MAEAAQPKASSGGSRVMLWLLVLGLVGAVWWLASERNARKYWTGSNNGSLQVSKGRFFPFGSSGIDADDRELGPVYGPLPLPSGARPLPDTEYGDQTELNRGLFDLIVGWTRADLKKGDEPSLHEADSYAARLSALPGLSPAQLNELAALRGDLAFGSVKTDLQAAVQSLQAARRKLEEVRRGAGDYAADAVPLAAQLDALLPSLRDLAGARTPGPSGPAPGPASQPASASAQAAQPAAASAQAAASASAQPASSASAQPASPSAQPVSSAGQPGPRAAQSASPLPSAPGALAPGSPAPTAPGPQAATSPQQVPAATPPRANPVPPTGQPEAPTDAGARAPSGQLRSGSPR